MSSKLAIARAYFAARREKKLDLPIPDVPITSEDTMTAEFERYNRLKLTLDEARRLAQEELETGANPHKGYSFGLSTGTTGEPGVFITTQAERDRWLGSILGKYLSPTQLLTLNAALILKHNNRLYDVPGRVQYYDITKPFAAAINQQKPNVLIGPPSALLTLAGPAQLRPHTVITTAEPLFPQDREKLRQTFQVTPRNLYQAKEGFLAAGCVHGNLHWNEDLMRLELLPFKNHPNRAVPVITDFTRESQSFVRYRIDDVVMLDANCPCRTPFQKVSLVEGRLQDVLLRGNEPVFPLDLNELLQPLGDYTVHQHSPDHIRLECNPSPNASIVKELRSMLGHPGHFEFVPFRTDPPGRKRRRFHRHYGDSTLNSLFLL